MNEERFEYPHRAESLRVLLTAEHDKEFTRLKDAAQREKERADEWERKAIAQSEDVQKNWLSPVEAAGLRERIKTLQMRLDAAMRVVEVARKLRNKVHRKGDQWRPKADPVPLHYLAELEDFDNTLADFDAVRKAG